MSLLNATWFAGYKQLSFFTDTSLALQLLNSEADINIAQEFGIGILIIICSIVILALIQQLLSFISRPPVEKKAVSVTIVSDFECILLEKLSYLESTSARKLMRTLQSELPTLELKQVNSVLYKMLTRNLVIMRKEGDKPIWSLAL